MNQTEIKILDAFCEHLDSNWHASLGYGDDDQVIRHALVDEDWLLSALGMTPDDFIGYYHQRIIATPTSIPDGKRKDGDD